MGNLPERLPFSFSPGASWAQNVLAHWCVCLGVMVDSGHLRTLLRKCPSQALTAVSNLLLPGCWAPKGFLEALVAPKERERRASKCHAWNEQNWNRREGGRAQPLKEWQSPWGYNINCLVPARSKMVEESTSSGPSTSLYAHCNILAYAKWHTHQCHDNSKADHKRPKSGQWTNSWKSPLLPQNTWNNPPTH